MGLRLLSLKKSITSLEYFCKELLSNYFGFIASGLQRVEKHFKLVLPDWKGCI